MGEEVPISFGIQQPTTGRRPELLDNQSFGPDNGPPATGTISLSRMSWFKKFKKSKKSRQSSEQPAVLAIPAHLVPGPPGFCATLDPGTYPEGALRSTEIQQSMVLIRLWSQVQTTEEVLGSQL